MRFIRASVAGLIIGGAVGLCGATAASAAPVDASAATNAGSVSVDSRLRESSWSGPMGGGEWSYGVGASTVYSVYNHGRVKHSASVKSSGVTKSSGWKSAGTLASATRPKAFSGNQAFWNLG